MDGTMPSADSAGQRAASNPRRILVVEDHESSLEALAGVLRRDGHQVTTARCLAEAITAAGAAEFDLLIADLGLPDGSGCALMRELKHTRKLAGIVLTGYGMQGDVEESRAAGFSAHAVKPIDITQLRKLIAEVTMGEPPFPPPLH